MPAVFLGGVMAWAPVTGLLIGDRAGAAEPVDLPDTEVVLDPDLPFPVCAERPGSKGRGLLVRDVDDATLARLDFVAAAIGLRPERRQVAGTGAVVHLLAGPAEAGARACEFDDWTVQRGDFALHALRELVLHEGRFGPEDLSRRMPMILARAEARTTAGAHPAPTHRRSATRSDQVETITEKVAHAGFFLTRAYDLRHPSLHGGMSPDVNREVFVATDAAIILPYDPARDRVLLVEQFRMGPFGRGDPYPYVLEPVAGRVDAGETPEAAAARECQEEAGVTLHRIEHVSSHYCSPGCSTEFFHCYVGLCDLPQMGTGQGGVADEHEDIRTHVLDFADAMDMVRTGEANNGPLVLILLWLERERDRLRSLA